MARKQFAVVVNYDRGQARIESPPPAKEQLKAGWEVLYVRPTRTEASELMRAMAPVLRPEIQAMEAVPA